MTTAMGQPTADGSILDVRDLRVHYDSVFGVYRSVDGVDFSVRQGEIFGIIGESGSGKSTLVDGVLRLVRPPGRIPTGVVLFRGTDLLRLGDEELQKARWTKIAYVPQGAMNSLNPVIRIGEQLTDAIIDHAGVEKEAAVAMAVPLLREVGLPPTVMRMYAHELSGGMKQRVAIAAATALKPSLVLADEPTTALDVVVQRGILQLLKDLKELHAMTLVVVSHDLAIQAQLADRIGIMYAGTIVEIGSVYEVYEEPLHPYTRALVAAIPTRGKGRVQGIPGLPPSPLAWPSGCRFHPRCPRAFDRCPVEQPTLEPHGGPGRTVACHLYGKEGERRDA